MHKKECVNHEGSLRKMEVDTITKNTVLNTSITLDTYIHTLKDCSIALPKATFSDLLWSSH